MSTAPCGTKVSPWAGAHQHGNGGVQGTPDGVVEAGSPVPHGGKPHGHHQPLLCAGSLQASEHRHKLGGAGEQPQTGRAMGPPWPGAHPGGLRQQFGPQHCVPAMLGSCAVTTGPASTDQHPTQLDAPKSQQPQMPSPEHPKLCLQHHSGAQSRQKRVPGPAPAAGREPMGPVFGQKDGNRHPEQEAQPPFSLTPTLAWAWAARSLQLLGRPSNRQPGLGRSPWPPRLQPHHRGQRGTAGSSSAQRVKHGSRTGSITSARLRF